MQVKVIGVSGGSASGKTTFARHLHSILGPRRSAILAQDSYYYDHQKTFAEGRGHEVNFDHPNSIDFDLLADHVKLLKAEKKVESPIYDFTTHGRTGDVEIYLPTEFLIVEGTLVLSQECVWKEFDLSVFIDIEENTRFDRRLKRDVRERGRTEESIRAQFFDQVKPMHDRFVQPSQENATLIMSDNAQELEMIDEVLKRFDINV